MAGWQRDVRTIDDNWQPPGGLGAAAADSPFPIAPLVIGAMLVALLGVSFLAFRRDRPTDG